MGRLVTDVVVAGASAGPSLTAVGTAKTEAKSLSAARETHPRPGELSTVAADAETRATNLLEGVGGRQASYVARVRENRNSRQG